MISINPYIYFNGNCEEAFRYYERVFQTEISHISRYKDAPEAARNMFTAADDKIMHVTLLLRNEMALHGSDHSSVYEDSEKHKTFSLIIHADSEQEVNRLFNALSQHGTIIVPVGLTFWGAYYGQCIDQFGISWKITTP